LKNLLLILTCVVLGVCGQLLLKQGMSADPDRVDQASEVLPRLLKAAVNPIVIAGFLFYGISAALWLIVLTRSELSYAYPLLSTGYVIVVFLSRVFFHESVTASRWVGTLVICVGVWLISRTQ
jgi:multidrug transporter EmrE-like cation transporter